DATPARWFGPDFPTDAPERAALLADLAAADAASYAAVCEALAVFDVRSRLHEIATPLTAVAGNGDATVTVATLREIADGIQHGTLVTLNGVGHLAPAEAPDAVAAAVIDTAQRTVSSRTTAWVRAAGMRVRREVLGDAHVDRATASATDLTTDFQDMITQYAWGGIWTRPGLDRRSRSMITLTALVARGHHEELALHLRAARTNGVSVDEIKELLMQTAIYCGVPDANTAFRIAQSVLAEETTSGDEGHS
ncbi:MAG: 4-carboxymuconolactone decarboxylase, partial [Jatrophihabitans sp.]